jgi:nucleotide-binding universal stress UspA family protein
MNEIRRIMVICDIVSDCGEIVRAAAGVARPVMAELYVLAVIYNPFGIIGLSFPRPSLWRDYQALIDKTRKDLEQLISLEKRTGIAVYGLIREGKPPDEIAAAIREKHIDLLIVSAYTQTRLESLLAGRFNKTLLRNMPCSVLFLKKEPRSVPDEEEESNEEEAA